MVTFGLVNVVRVFVPAFRLINEFSILFVLILTPKGNDSIKVAFLSFLSLREFLDFYELLVGELFNKNIFPFQGRQGQLSTLELLFSLAGLVVAEPVFDNAVSTVMFGIITLIELKAIFVFNSVVVLVARKIRVTDLRI